MFKLLIRFGIAVVLACPSLCAAASNTVLVSIPASVCTFQMGDTPEQSCKQIIYMQVPKTGRAEFTVPSDVGVIGFSGGKDVQVSSQDYLLKLDSILVGRGDGTSSRTKASGTCTMRNSVSGDYVSAVKCTAQTEFGPATLTLIGSNQKVTFLNP